MAKEEKSEMATIAKKQLEGRGYVLSLSTTRDGENLIGKVRVTEASTQRTVASFVSVWKIDNMELVFGIDAGRGHRTRPGEPSDEPVRPVQVRAAARK